MCINSNTYIGIPNPRAGGISFRRARVNLQLFPTAWGSVLPRWFSLTFFIGRSSTPPFTLLHEGILGICNLFSPSSKPLLRLWLSTLYFHLIVLMFHPFDGSPFDCALWFPPASICLLAPSGSLVCCLRGFSTWHHPSGNNVHNNHAYSFILQGSQLIYMLIDVILEYALMMFHCFFLWFVEDGEQGTEGLHGQGFFQHNGSSLLSLHGRLLPGKTNCLLNFRCSSSRFCGLSLLVTDNLECSL